MGEWENFTRTIKIVVFGWGPAKLTQCQILILEKKGKESLASRVGDSPFLHPWGCGSSITW